MTPTTLPDHDGSGEGDHARARPAGLSRAPRRSLAARLAWTVTASTLLGACAHGPAPVPTGPTVEVALDEGRAAERPLIPAQSFELLVRIDPQLPTWTARRMRLLLAQPGPITFTFYQETAEGTPGAPVASIAREYDASLVSSGKDGKWVVEPLALPPQRGPLWLGIFSHGGGDPRLWATSNDSGQVFQRDPDPATPLSSTRQRRTPILRVEVTPDS